MNYAYQVPRRVTVSTLPRSTTPPPAVDLLREVRLIERERVLLDVIRIVKRNPPPENPSPGTSYPLIPYRAARSRYNEILATIEELLDDCSRTPRPENDTRTQGGPR